MVYNIHARFRDSQQRFNFMYLCQDCNIRTDIVHEGTVHLRCFSDADMKRIAEYAIDLPDLIEIDIKKEW